ncbi:hypothetical protein AB0A74_40055 [Saccharothrix sp. NPDC042600]|uniref:hypothetical protein n=1 Tax=Saccharothrix TaxID=2071 RepID=UPI00340FDBE6|nr:hypothetical protein GCM10017745_71760 [Saccharothrix mutabilis subsp. capreolus]
MKRPWWVVQLFWAAPLLVGVSCFVMWLLLLGNKGEGIADAVSLLVGTASLIVTVLGFQHSGTVRTTAVERIRKPLPRWVFAAVPALLGVLGGLGFWLVVVKPDVPVTDLVELSNAEDMADGEQASFRVPGSPPERRYLFVTPTLVNHEKVGDCVGSARLTVTLVRDGRKDAPLEDRLSGREIRLDLRGTAREARVLVELSMPDEACRVDLGVTEAVLYN